MESLVFNKSDIPIHVDSSRSQTLDSSVNKSIVVHNKPSLLDLLPIEDYEKKVKKNSFKVLLSGGIYKHRGAIKISDAIEYLTDKGYKIELNVIGFGDKEIVNSLKNKLFVNYHGYVDSMTAQRFSFESDLIACLYDPSSSINRLASPNKIFDAVANSSMALVNREITNKTVHREDENIVYCDYNDTNSIASAIKESMNYIRKNQNQEKLLERAKSFRKKGLWENEFQQVIDILNNFQKGYIESDKNKLWNNYYKI